MKLKSKVLFLLSLILLIFSSGVFAVNIETQGGTMTVQFKSEGSIGVIDISGLQGSGATYTLTDTNVEACFNYNPALSWSDNYGAESKEYNGGAKSTQLAILTTQATVTNSNTGTVTISDGQQTVLTITVEINSGLDGSDELEGLSLPIIVDPAVNTTAAINGGALGSNISGTNYGTNYVNYSPNQVLAYNNENLGVVTDTSNYSGRFTLDSENPCMTDPIDPQDNQSDNENMINATVEYRTTNTNPIKVSAVVYDLDLVVYPSITNLSFVPVGFTPITDQYKSYDYEIGASGNASEGERISVVNDEGDSSTALLFSGNPSDGENKQQLPALQIYLSYIAPNIVGGNPTTYESAEGEAFYYGSVTTDDLVNPQANNFDNKQLRLENSIGFVMTNPELASFSTGGVDQTVQFSNFTGSSHMYAEIKSPQVDHTNTSYHPVNANADGSGLPSSSAVNQNAFNQYITISNNSSESAAITNIDFTNNSLTFFNNNKEQDLTTGMVMSTRNPLGNDYNPIAELTWSVTLANGTGRPTYFNSNGAINSSSPLSGLSLETYPGPSEVVDGYTTVGLQYNGVNKNDNAGSYVLNVTYTNDDGQVVTESTNFTITDSNYTRGTITITDSEGNPINEPMQLPSGVHSIDLGTTATGFNGESGVYWTISNLPSNSGAYIDEVTGELTIPNPMAEGDAVEVTAYQYGTYSTPVYISTPPPSILDVEGIEPVQDPLYTYPGQTGINLFNNLQLIPDTASRTFLDPEDFYITTSNPEFNNNVLGSGANYEDITIPESFGPGPITVTITYKQNQNITTSFVLNVGQRTPATGISVPPTFQMREGQVRALAGQIELLPENNTSRFANSLINDGNGYIMNPALTVQDYLFENTNPVFASSDNSVVSVNSLGQLVAEGTGTATVYVTVFTADDYGIYEGQTTVTVGEQQDVTAITATPDNLTVKLGDTADVTVTTTPSDYQTGVTWTSENDAIASVEMQPDGNLVITGTGLGTTTITGTYNDVTETITVTVSETGVVNPDSIAISPATIYLTSLTGDNYVNSQALTITPTPAEGTTLDNVVLTSSAPTVATVAKNEEGQWVVTAVSQGDATITASIEGDTEFTSNSVQVIVSDEQVVFTAITATPTTPGDPDNYNVAVTGVQGNPAMGLQDTPIEKVSIFNWSTSNQSDMNAKIAQNLGGGNFAYNSFPVNNTNEYFNYADNIYIHVYAKLTTQVGEGSYLGNADRSWMDEISADEGNMAYIGYCADVGFDQSSQFTGDSVPVTYIGSTGNARQMEGLRISSNIPGVEVQTSVHVENLDWQPFVGDGVYAGTMHRALQIEAMRLQLTGPNAPNYTIQYRVHQQDLSWSAWTSDGQTAGTTGMGLQMEAAQVRIVPVGTALPQ